jgi:hypothetical protein
MKDLKLLKMDICLGNLVWIESNDSESTMMLTKKMLNCVGVDSSEVAFLTAERFSNCDYGDFSNMFLKPIRVLLIEDTDFISGETRNRFLNKLETYKTFKHRFDVCLVLISSFGKNQRKFLKELKHEFQFTGFDEPLEMNEVIHDSIEISSVDLGKVVWKMQPEVAEIFEETYKIEGERYLKELIHFTVKDAQTKVLRIENVFAARRKLLSGAVKIELG